MNYIILLSEPCFLFSSTNFFYISQINNLVLWLHGYHDQIEIINDLPADKTITVYRCGPLVDLCRGPHIPNTSFVKAIACLKVRINYFISLPFLVLIYPLTYVNGKYFGFIGYCIWNSRLHQHIGGGTKIGKVYKEFMAYLILIRKVWRWFSFHMLFLWVNHSAIQTELWWIECSIAVPCGTRE